SHPLSGFVRRAYVGVVGSVIGGLGQFGRRPGGLLSDGARRSGRARRDLRSSWGPGLFAPVPPRPRSIRRPGWGAGGVVAGVAPGRGLRRVGGERAGVAPGAAGEPGDRSVAGAAVSSPAVI